ncbi:MAG: hypothetical protein E6G23_09785 [Actinobacteria bacterium]|nr:MAG: hypothetical protein E6G23_09785 [Actinomycetota bacterium]
MKLTYLIRGLPGHPLHPPLTDATIGAYTAAAVLGFASIVGVAEKGAAHGWWLALVLGLIFTVPTALAGLALIAALTGHGGYTHGAVDAGLTRSP